MIWQQIYNPFGNMMISTLLEAKAPAPWSCMTARH